MVFAIHWHESAESAHLFPILRNLCRNESALLSVYQSVNPEFNPGAITGLRDRLNHFQDNVAHWWNHTSLSFEHGFALAILTTVFSSVQFSSVTLMCFTGSSNGKESACNSGDRGSIPGLGRSPGGGHGTHSTILAWRIHMDRGAWRATVRWSLKEWDTTDRLSTANSN